MNVTQIEQLYNTNDSLLQRHLISQRSIGRWHHNMEGGYKYSRYSIKYLVSAKSGVTQSDRTAVDNVEEPSKGGIAVTEA